MFRCKEIRPPIRLKSFKTVPQCQELNKRRKSCESTIEGFYGKKVKQLIEVGFYVVRQHKKGSVQFFSMPRICKVLLQPIYNKKKMLKPEKTVQTTESDESKVIFRIGPAHTTTRSESSKQLIQRTPQRSQRNLQINNFSNLRKYKTKSTQLLQIPQLSFRILKKSLNF